MEIPFCPTLKPSMKEFQNFRQYVENLDAIYKKDYGMVRIIPPAQWKARKTDINGPLKNLIITGPIEQNVFGKGGIYQCLHFPKKSLTFEEYKTKSQELDKITENMSAEEVEILFWKNIAFSPPLYGADILNTLMDESAGSWNLNELDSILQQSLQTRVKGVNTPYCYVGSWKALFCWHTEDLDLSAINYIHEGKSKFWYAVHWEDRHLLEEEARKLFPQQSSNCHQFLRHKTTLINPNIIKKRRPELRIVKTEHKENQFIIVFGGCYHTGFNFGFNVAEAVNYGTIDWLRQVFNAGICKCSRSSVRASFSEIARNLAYSSVRHTKEYRQFRQKVSKIVESEQKKIQQQQQQESEDEMGPSRKEVKSALSRQIKKLKKVPKTMTYNNQQYKIQQWAQCDKCSIWRVVEKPVTKNEKFWCKGVGKRCSRAERMSKNMVTL